MYVEGRSHNRSGQIGEGILYLKSNVLYIQVPYACIHTYVRMSVHMY